MRKNDRMKRLEENFALLMATPSKLPAIIRSVFTKVFERSQGTCLFITKDEVANSFFNVYLKNSRKEGKNLCLNMRVPSFWEENCYDLYRST